MLLGFYGCPAAKALLYWFFAQLKDTTGDWARDGVEAEIVGARRWPAAIQYGSCFCLTQSIEIMEILHLLGGGAAIGAAAAVLIGLNGRIAGISGIYGRLLQLRPGYLGWRLMFVLGLMLPGLWLGLQGTPLLIQAKPLIIIASGLLVGIGTHMASGCTSGHGVCGMANVSSRSMVATLIFMAVAMLTRYLVGAVA